jgi:hypothetical protein
VNDEDPNTVIINAIPMIAENNAPDSSATMPPLEANNAKIDNPMEKDLTYVYSKKLNKWEQPEKYGKLFYLFFKTMWQPLGITLRMVVCRLDHGQYHW